MYCTVVYVCVLLCMPLLYHCFAVKAIKAPKTLTIVKEYAIIQVVSHYTFHTVKYVACVLLKARCFVRSGFFICPQGAAENTCIQWERVLLFPPPFALSENCRRYSVGAAVLSLLQSMQVYHSYINAFVSEQLLHFL